MLPSILRFSVNAVMSGISSELIPCKIVIHGEPNDMHLHQTTSPMKTFTCQYLLALLAHALCGIYTSWTLVCQAETSCTQRS